jgi:hypothetical protein
MLLVLSKILRAICQTGIDKSDEKLSVMLVLCEVGSKIAHAIYDKEFHLRYI